MYRSERATSACRGQSAPAGTLIAVLSHGAAHQARREAILGRDFG